MTSTASTDLPDSKRARVDKQPSDDSDSSDDVIGKAALLVDARNLWPSPSATCFKITEAMPERMRQSLKKNLSFGKHSYQITTCRPVTMTDDNERTVLFGADDNPDELVEEGDMEEEDARKIQEFFSKLLASPPSCVIEEPLAFVFHLE